MRRGSVICFVWIGILVFGGFSADAGMPALLPTPWKADSATPSWAPSAGRSASGGAQWQALSFFLACLALLPAGVRLLWNGLRNEFPQLPRLRYRQALTLVLLWGLCFVVVLTMISGARELMTPGAWRKQGWTYKLADDPVVTAGRSEETRRQGLEALRFALWQYAARHDGQFPDSNDVSIPSDLWNVPANPGMQFLYCPARSTAEGSQLLAYEPDIDHESRLVLYTSGLIGTMRTEDLERQLADKECR